MEPVLLYAGFFLLVCALSRGGEPDPYERARWDMVENQIMSRGVTDRVVVQAMLKVPRHLFIPENLRHTAYNDNPVPIGSGQTVSQPYIVALMTALLKPGAGKKVLEIGTGSGYQTAVLKETGSRVYTIEIISDLAKKARTLLEDIGYEGIEFRTGDGYKGWPGHAPFDGIIVTAAPEKIPETLLEQLAEGGKMVIPVGSDDQELLLIEKTSGGIEKKRITPVRFVPMTGGSA